MELGTNSGLFGKIKGKKVGYHLVVEKDEGLILRFPCQTAPKKIFALVEENRRVKNGVTELELKMAVYERKK